MVFLQTAKTKKKKITLRGERTVEGKAPLDWHPLQTIGNPAFHSEKRTFWTFFCDLKEYGFIFMPSAQWLGEANYYCR